MPTKYKFVSSKYNVRPQIVNLRRQNASLYRQTANLSTQNAHLWPQMTNLWTKNANLCPQIILFVKCHVHCVIGLFDFVGKGKRFIRPKIIIMVSLNPIKKLHAWLSPVCSPPCFHPAFTVHTALC